MQPIASDEGLEPLANAHVGDIGNVVQAGSAEDDDDEGFQFEDCFDLDVHGLAVGVEDQAARAVAPSLDSSSAGFKVSVGGSEADAAFFFQDVERRALQR